MTSHSFSPGDRVITASGRPGVIAPCEWSLGSAFTLVRFDNGALNWIRADLLQPAPAEAETKLKPKRMRRKAA